MKARFSTPILAALAPIRPTDPDELLTFICDLETYAIEARREREALVVRAVFRCEKCHKMWSAPMTVERERDRPGICPACWNAANAGRVPSWGGEPHTESAYTSTFRYEQ